MSKKYEIVKELKVVKDIEGGEHTLHRVRALRAILRADGSWRKPCLVPSRRWRGTKRFQETGNEKGTKQW